MTPLGLNTTAVSETAALFPLSAAIPPAAESSSASGGAASTAFGDLLAANFAQPAFAEASAGKSEPPQDLTNADLANSAFNALSLADVWFAGLNVDLSALNASLEVEESGLPAEAALAAAIPAGEADAVNDEAAALMALAMSVPAPGAWPEGHLLQIPDDAVSSGAPPSGCAGGRYIEAATAGAPEVVAPQARSADASIREAKSTDPAAAAAVLSAPAGSSARSESAAPVAAVATPEAEAARPSIVVPDAAGEVETLVPRKTAAVVTQAPQLPDVQQPEAPAAPAPLQEPSVEGWPKESLSRVVLESAPAVHQTGRTRESVVAKLTEMSGLGVGGEAVAKPAPGTSLDADSQSQSQTQEGSTHDAFALGVKDNAAPARSVDGAPVTPAFSVAAPVAGAARAVVVEGATLPPAPPAATVPGPENVGRLIESMRVQMRQGVQEATVRLNPEHLGEVTISVRVDRGAVSAVVNAETPAVQQWLEAQEEKLRSGLSDQGLQLAKFVVHRDGSQQHREQPQQQKQAARDRQQHDGAPLRFEVIV